MNREQITAYLDKRDIEYDGRWSDDKLMAIVAQYEETFAAKQKVALEANVPESPTASEQIKKGVPTFAKQTTTEEQVREAAKRYIEKEGFVANFKTDPESGVRTWHFKYKGAEEAGNMDIPLRVIVAKAEGVARGARGINALSKGDGTYKGHNDIIIMG